MPRTIRLSRMAIPVETCTTTDRLLLDEEQPLPETASVEEAIMLFLTDQCSLGRAAELAGVTRWDLQDILKARSIPIMIYSGKSVEEMDKLADRLVQEGLIALYQ